jgi:hypothetical protein
LPAGTTADELREMFAKHGVLGRLVLPPSGVTGMHVIKSKQYYLKNIGLLFFLLLDKL